MATDVPLADTAPIAATRPFGGDRMRRTAALKHEVYLRELEAEARYARERYQLYNARSYSSHPTSGARLRELKRASDLAQMRLDRAKAPAHSPDDATELVRSS